jgi:hypothetical protein
MRRRFSRFNRTQKAKAFKKLWKPINKMSPKIPKLVSRGDRPLQMEFEEELKSLVFFHLQEHQSGRHLIQVLEEDNFAIEHIAPKSGIKKSSFFEAINTRGIEQFFHVFKELYKQASGTLPKEYEHLGDLVAIDGSLINGVLSMHWADYREGSKKAKVHLGFDINHSIPSKIYLTHGKANERPFVQKILSPGQTGILDRGYQHHDLFDQWQNEKIHFICRIKANTHKHCIEHNSVADDSIVFYDAKALLGELGVNRTEAPVRVVGYRVAGVDYWIATDRFDLTGEDIALAYKLRWEIEKFFGWWKRYLKVYHLIARSQYGLMVQILSGLITYLLLSIYCHDYHNEKVNVKRLRQLRIQIQNEARGLNDTTTYKKRKRKMGHKHSAKT